MYNIKNQTVKLKLVLTVVVVLAIAALVLLLTKHSTTKKAGNSSANSVTQNAVTGSLTIKEWGVKIPLTGNTKSASYQIDLKQPDLAKLIVKIAGDNLGYCSAQTNIARIDADKIAKAAHIPKPKIDPAVIAKNYSTVNGIYYEVVPSLTNCTTDKTLQQKADTIKADFVAEKLAIVAE